MKKYLVQRMGIWGQQTVYSVWEDLEGHWMESSLGRENQMFGRVGTRELPDKICAMPFGKAREKAVFDWQTEQNELAYRLIRQAFPDAEGKESLGQIIRLGHCDKKEVREVVVERSPEMEVTMTVTVKVRCAEGMLPHEAKSAACGVVAERLAALPEARGDADQPIEVEFRGIHEVKNA